VLVDGVASAGQLRPLLPGTASCLLLATSRDRLQDMVIREGAAALRLDVLGTLDAVELLVEVIGRRRVEAEPTAVRTLVGLCGRIPLTLRTAAAHLADNPRLPVRALVASTPLNGPRVA
jgi:hypothetical protein